MSNPTAPPMDSAQSAPYGQPGASQQQQPVSPGGTSSALPPPGYNAAISSSYPAGYYGPQGAYPPPQGPYSPQQGYYAPPNGEYPKGGYPPANAYYSSPPPQQMPPPQSPPNGGYINNQFAPSVQVYESAPAQTTVITVQGGGVVGLRPISTEIERALYNQLFYIQAVLCVLTGVCCALSVIPVPGVIDGYVGAYTAPPIVIIFSFGSFFNALLHLILLMRRRLTFFYRHSNYFAQILGAIVMVIAGIDMAVNLIDINAARSSTFVQFIVLDVLLFINAVLFLWTVSISRRAVMLQV